MAEEVGEGWGCILSFFHSSFLSFFSEHNNRSRECWDGIGKEEGKQEGGRQRSRGEIVTHGKGGGGCRRKRSRGEIVTQKKANETKRCQN